MGKTETIKERSIWVYVPTLEQRKQWEKLAQNSDVSLSKWIVKTIEDSLLVIDKQVKNRSEVEKENQNLRKAIADLQEKLRQVTIIRENLEKEITKYRTEPFLTSKIGSKHYDRELIEILRQAKGVDGKIRHLDNDEILSRLGVKFTDLEAVKAISLQLTRLEGYGLIESSTKGWKWKDEQ